MDVIYCFGDSFSYRTPARDYEQFPIEEEKKKAQGKSYRSKHITQLRDFKTNPRTVLSQILNNPVRKWTLSFAI